MRPSSLSDLLKKADPSGGGRWDLTRNHEIRYRSGKNDETLVLKGPIIAAEPNALVIALTQKQSDQKIVTRTAKLTGTWRLDSKNRIVFEVEKSRGRTDKLTFKGAWHVGKSNRLIYAYREAPLKTKRKLKRELVFTGYWDISEDRRLTYWLGGDSDSAFRFRGAFQTKSILAKKGEIRYQAGVEAKGKRAFREIILFGKWKLSRTLSVTFEIEYEEGRRKTIRFGSQMQIRPGVDARFKLKNRRGDRLGIEVIFTKDVLGKNGQAFVRLVRDLEERRIEAGLRGRW